MKAILVSGLAPILLGILGLVFERQEPGYSQRMALMRGVGTALIVAGTLLALFRRFIARRWSQLVLALSVTLVSLVIFLAGDIYVGHRAAYAAAQRPEGEFRFVPDPRLGWSNPTNARKRHTRRGNYDVVYEFDADGFKTVHNRGEARRSIYVFGDSFIFGEGVGNEGTFANVMAREYLAADVHVFNAGVSGHGITQMYARLLTLRDRIDAGDIVVFAPISGDLRRNLDDFYYVGSIVYHIFPGAAEVFPTFERGEIRTVSLDDAWLRFKSYFFVGKSTRKIFTFLKTAASAPGTTRKAGEMIERAAALTRQRGGDFVVTFLPTPHELRRGRYRQDVSRIPFESVWDQYPQGDASWDIRFPGDGHWNLEGHAITARVIAGLLLRRGLLADRDLQPGAAASLGPIDPGSP